MGCDRPGRSQRGNSRIDSAARAPGCREGRKRSSGTGVRAHVPHAAAREKALATRGLRVRRRRVPTADPLSSAPARSSAAPTERPGTCGGTRSRFRSCGRAARRASRAGFRSPDHTMRKCASRWGCGPLIGVGGREMKKIFRARCCRRIGARAVCLHQGDLSTIRASGGEKTRPRASRWAFREPYPSRSELREKPRSRLSARVRAAPHPSPEQRSQISSRVPRSKRMAWWS